MLARVTPIFLATFLIAATAGTSVANAAPARYEGSSSDGSVAFFSTFEQMVNGDTDSREDVFARAYSEDIGEYVTREVSIGPVGGNDAYDASYKASSADGRRVFFATRDRLTPDDQDESLDIYMRNLDDNTTTLVSKGDPSCAAQGCGNGAFGANFAPGGLADGGKKLFFLTQEKLSPDDGDSS